VYPEPRVTEFVSKNFIPVRLHVKKHPEAMGRFGADWTPTVMLLDPNGQERHRIEGFLPADDFLAQLELGLGHLYFKTGRFAESEKQFRDVVDKLPNTTSAAEAQYWAGVSKYKGGGDASALTATAAAFKQRYADTDWAKKASIWG
jgi:hypothetical protein